MSVGGITHGGGFDIMKLAPFARVPSFNWRDPNSLLAAMASTLPDYSFGSGRTFSSSASSSGGRSGGSNFGSQSAYNDSGGDNLSENMGYQLGGYGGGGGGGGGGFGGGGVGRNYGYSTGSNYGRGGSAGRQSGSNTGGNYSYSTSSQDSFNQEEGVRGQEAKMAGFGNIAAVVAAELMRMDRLNKVFPFITSQWNALQRNDSEDMGPGPEITAQQIWSPQQLQQQINAGKASNAAQMATNVRELQERMAGRGVGSDSPLAQALMGQQSASQMAANSALDRETRMTAAQENAEQLLKSQSQREVQFANRAAEDIERKKVITARMNALIGALSGMV